MIFCGDGEYAKFWLEVIMYCMHRRVWLSDDRWSASRDVDVIVNKRIELKEKRIETMHKVYIKK